MRASTHSGRPGRARSSHAGRHLGDLEESKPLRLGGEEEIMHVSRSVRRLAALGAVGAIALGACGSGSASPSAAASAAASAPATATASQGAAASAAASAAPSASANMAPAKIVWSTWGNPDELTRFDEFDKQFMQKHPNITVVLQPVADYSEYHAKLLAQLTSGTAPDVFYVGDDNIGKFVSSGALMPLDDRMNAPDSAAPASSYFDGLFGAARKDNVTYGVPNDVNPDMFWYDKKALAAAGITDDPATLASQNKWTIDAFLGMIDKLKAAKLKGAMFWNYWATHYSWVSVNGGQSWDANGNFVMTKDPTSVAALDVLGKRFQDGSSFVVADNIPDPGPDSLFVTHKAGFYVQGRYTIGTIQAAGDPQDYDVVRWPTVDGSAKPTGVAASYLAINKSTPSPDAAWTFFSEFVNAEGQTFRLQGGGNAVPSVKGADAVVLDGYPPNAQAMLDARNVGFAAIPAEQVHPGLSTDISDAMLKFYEGKATLDQTLTTLDTLVANAK
jgi:multiple sugar transport system substrate-binding protein